MKDSVISVKAFPNHSWVVAGTCERNGGVSIPPFNTLNTSKSGGDVLASVEENRQRVLKHFSLENTKLTPLNLNHTNKVIILSQEHPDLPSDPADAVILTIPNTTLLMSSADCAPVFIIDTKKKIAALAHAGWRGIDQNIAKEVINEMKKLGSEVTNLHIYIGPSIGPCCYMYEIPNQKGTMWEPFLHKQTDGKHSIDLWGLLTKQLLDTGIPEKNINNSRICTGCNTDKYFSCFKEKPVTGRFASVLCIL